MTRLTSSDRQILNLIVEAIEIEALLVSIVSAAGTDDWQRPGYGQDPGRPKSRAALRYTPRSLKEIAAMKPDPNSLATNKTEW